ncbi:hypothetical protein TVAG_262050 [Trichomonas vaginalis G3]|uniref:DUF3447 domain-containing protein n=1 Tax=Trichomonas vaginalis (strain ATCC PRA-98 / G3) TaxID=412133 RepID=A2DUB7_TRIV3|nr:spectrin binding [Trichomonas vaginalis G3]EAY15955.1 hypothetical protein TVAG_262050 [Trichomonas vaginalis G3]KAI5523589.1 spectrin binding [Trichomonas vaginalis G3]|eukprot:XP_001328178.1 hypothetical protein [Trichomonas vaginalis G3]
MSDQNVHPNKYSEFRSIYKYFIDPYNALYQLKVEKEEELNSIYKMIKTELIDSKKIPPQMIIRNILSIIPYKNRYTRSYLSLAKHISDDYQVREVINVELISNYLFYEEYGIKLKKYDYFDEIKLENLNIHSENTIYRAIMYNDLEKFISFTETDGFDKDQKLESRLYPNPQEEFSLLELCCYHGAVDCFKLLRTKFNSEITQQCLELSFLGGNPEIMSECLKHQHPNEECMIYAIISHNIDFVTFLMNEYNIGIDLKYCGMFNNLEAFFVYYDQTNDISNCFINSAWFDIPSICEYFLSHDSNINAKDEDLETALHKAAYKNCKSTAELLLSHGANIDEKNKYGKSNLHITVRYNNIETAELLLSHGANINEFSSNGINSLHYAVINNSKETAELLISYGINIKETAELLISYGININEKDEIGKTALHKAAFNNRKEITELFLLHGANVNEKDQHGFTALQGAAMNNCKEIVELLISHGANINKIIIME